MKEESKAFVAQIDAERASRRRGVLSDEQVAQLSDMKALLATFPARRARREKGDEAAELAVTTPHEAVWLEMHGHHTVDFDHSKCDHPDDKLHNAHADCHCRDAERAALKAK